MPQAHESSSTIPVGNPKALRCTGMLCPPAGHATSKSKLGNVLSAQHSGPEKTPGITAISVPAPSQALG